MTDFQRHRRIALVAFAVVLFAGVVLWRWLRVAPIERAARSVVVAYVSGDASTLENYEYEAERMKLGLDRTKIAMVFDELVKPRQSGFEPVGKLSSEVNRDLSQGMAYLHLRNAKGQRLEVSATPWDTPDGPKVNVLYNLMCNAWRAEFLVKRGIPTSTRNILEARLIGLAQDVPRLERMGIPGFILDTPEQSVIPWKAYEASV